MDNERDILIISNIYHEAYILGNKIGREDLDRATIKGAMGRIGSVIPNNGGGCIALSLKCHVWFRFWNHHLLAAKISPIFSFV